MADPDDRNHDGISGRANHFFDGRLGRFGRKAVVPTLREFNDGAFSAEQGITSPAVLTEELPAGQALPPGMDPTAEPEISAEDARLADLFVRFLAPPAPVRLTGEAKRGREIFGRIGCTGCHHPALTTGDNATPALRHQKVMAYSDLLLHDMGPDLADICLGQAAPSEFRTEPLMGARLSSLFLHDGRAATLEQAILFHGGEAARARALFQELSPSEQAALIKFLQSL